VNRRTYQDESGGVAGDGCKEAKTSKAREEM
jgi:hypothetical protein